MMKRIIHTPIATFIISLFLLPVGLLFSAQPLYACDLVPGSGAVSFEILTPWYKYLEGETVTKSDGSTDCRPAFGNANIAITAARIGVAVIEFMTRLAGFIALGFLIWGGIQYIISQGEPDGINHAKSTIANAITGLVITILAIGLVQFIGNTIT